MPPAAVSLQASTVEFAFWPGGAALGEASRLPRGGSVPGGGRIAAVTDGEAGVGMAGAKVAGRRLGFCAGVMVAG